MPGEKAWASFCKPFVSRSTYFEGTCEKGSLAAYKSIF
jgi:hypothetical protein